jgi:glycosyltransferase involved in cell wall biosynthesis
MRISINNGDSAVWTGHGYVTLKLISNIAKTKHSVILNRPSDFEMTFSHPKYYKFLNEKAYKIGYTAWESTEIPEEWKDGLSKIDELWVPNQFCKNVMSKYFDKHIEVFPHGVDDVFSTKKRDFDGVIKYLHVGHPAYRKGLDLVLSAWEELYANDPKYHLTVKGYGDCSFPKISANNVTFINETISYEKMANLFYEHHVLLYPSWGEGFGLIPLQALATGMPVIMTMGWADYEHHTYETLIPSKLSYNPWQLVHPGKMFKPNYEAMKGLMIYVSRNIKDMLEDYYDIGLEIHKEYNWEKVVSEHFDAVEARLVV